MDVLETLLGGGPRLRLIRLFVFNPRQTFTLTELLKRLSDRRRVIMKELSGLEKVSLVKTKRLVEVVTKRRSSRRRKTTAWQLNEDFPFFSPLRAMFSRDLLRQRSTVADRFKRCGRIKFLAVAGVFLEEPASRADLVLAGDQLKRGKIEAVVKKLEAEIGRELNYATFETSDFIYRLGASDKFIRDILDYPHHRLIDRLVF